MRISILGIHIPGWWRNVCTALVIIGTQLNWVCITIFISGICRGLDISMFQSIRLINLVNKPFIGRTFLYWPQHFQLCLNCYQYPDNDTTPTYSSTVAPILGIVHHNPTPFSVFSYYIFRKHLLTSKLMFTAAAEPGKEWGVCRIIHPPPSPPSLVCLFSSTDRQQRSSVVMMLLFLLFEFIPLTPQD